MTSDNQEASITSNRVALVTGGTRGIGQEISKKLKKDGFFVIANYASNEQKALDFSNETGIETIGYNFRTTCLIFSLYVNIWRLVLW